MRVIIRDPELSAFAPTHAHMKQVNLIHTVRNALLTKSERERRQCGRQRKNELTM